MNYLSFLQIFLPFWMVGNKPGKLPGFSHSFSAFITAFFRMISDLYLRSLTNFYPEDIKMWKNSIISLWPFKIKSHEILLVFISNQWFSLNYHCLLFHGTWNQINTIRITLQFWNNSISWQQTFEVPFITNHL